MRMGIRLAAIAATVALSVGAVALAAPLMVPERTDAAIQNTTSTDLAGAKSELEKAMQEPSSVKYRVLIVEDTLEGEDRTDYLDRVLAQWGWPAANEMQVVVYKQGNHDVRFALGANFRQQNVSVDDVLSLLRKEYQPLAQKGDPSAGLAAFIRAVNQKMASTSNP